VREKAARAEVDGRGAARSTSMSQPGRSVVDRLVEGVRAGTVVTVSDALPDNAGGSGDAGSVVESPACPRGPRTIAARKTAKHELACGCPKPLHMSCDVLIFVEEPAGAVASLDLADLRRRPVGSGRRGAACPRLRCGR
jgi:hypothetical protein